MKIVLPVSRTFPKRSRNGVLFVAIGALATVASHLPTKHEVLPHTFSPLFSFFFHNSIKIHHSQPIQNRLSLASSSNVLGGSRVEQGSKRRMKSEPMHRSFLSPPPTLIDAYSIGVRWSRTPNTHWPHRQCVIYRSRYRRWQGCKNKTEKASSRAWNVFSMTSPRLLEARHRTYLCHSMLHRSITVVNNKIITLPSCSLFHRSDEFLLSCTFLLLSWFFHCSSTVHHWYIINSILCVKREREGEGRNI